MVDYREKAMLMNTQEDIFKNLEFHHIGIATKSISDEIMLYKMLGYKEETDFFNDYEQGIRGIFLNSDSGVRIELLENLPDSNILDEHIKKNNKNYHLAFLSETLIIKSRNLKMLKEPKYSSYFKKKVCFYIMKNMAIIELIEK